MPPSKLVIFQPRYGLFKSSRPTYPAPVIRGKDHHRIVREPLRLKRAKHSPHFSIQRANHGGIDTLRVIRDVTERIVVLPQRLERGVRRPMGKIEEEGAVLLFSMTFTASSV